jgi:hypothetical protein
MNKQKTTQLVAVILVLGAAAGAVVLQRQPDTSTAQIVDRDWWEPGSGEFFPEQLQYDNPHGKLGVINETPMSTQGHPFFEPLGSNGRACITCHQPANSMSLSVETIQKRWADTQGSDPLFAMVDGANCPNLTPGDPASHSLLLDHGLFRIGMPWPPRNAAGAVVIPEISLEVVEDPTGCNLDQVYGLNSANPTVSVFRRPRMSANLRYVTTSFSLSGRFDGKRGVPLAIDEKTGQRVGLPIMSDARHQTLEAQARDAITGHMQGGGSYPDEMIALIVDFESNLYVAQSADKVAGRFDASDTPRALGPAAMRDGNAIVAGFNYNNPVFFDFESWKASNNDISSENAEFRASVARGYEIFFERPMWISDVSWFNSIGMGNPYKRACAICHSVHLAGNDISPGVMDIGVNNLATQVMGSPKLPVFKVTCSEDAPPHPYLGREILTTDPGYALVSGKCIDVGSLVMQQMRGIASRAPYFSNGSAKDLAEVVEFYDLRFDMQMSEQEKTDLVNFMSVL